MVSSCSKFEGEIRSKVELSKEKEDSNVDSEGKKDPNSFSAPSNEVPEQRTTIEKENKELLGAQSASGSRNKKDLILNNNYMLKNNEDKVQFEQNDVDANDDKSESITGEECDKKLESSDLFVKNEKEVLMSLSEGCKENVLNVDYLLGRKNCPPFLTSDSLLAQDLLANPTRALKRRKIKRKRKQPNLNPLPGDKKEKDESKSSTSTSAEMSPVSMSLHSAKMIGLQALLCAEKLNTSAIQLQLTAQSQTTKGSADDADTAIGGAGGRPKRARRE